MFIGHLQQKYLVVRNLENFSYRFPKPVVRFAGMGRDGRFENYIYQDYAELIVTTIRCFLLIGSILILGTTINAHVTYLK